MVRVTFTQYIRPNGLKQDSFIDLPDDDELALKHQKIVDAGYVFEVEVLTTGQVSLTIGDPNQEVDVAQVICVNGPAVTEAVRKLITEFTPPDGN